jgi:hypothetical protein
MAVDLLYEPLLTCASSAILTLSPERERGKPRFF